MTKSILDSIANYKTILLKEITVLLFFVLPYKVTKTFIFLSLVNLLKEYGEEKRRENLIDLEKFKKTLECSFDEELLVLPSYTIDWFWGNDFLDSVIVIDSDTLSMRSIVNDRELFDKHHDKFLDKFIDNLPSILKLKIKASGHKGYFIKEDIYSILAV